MSLNLKELCAGTRPEISGGKVLLSGAAGFDGYEILEYKGMVWGISVRAKDMGQDCLMGCKQITGGELGSYSQLGDEARFRAVDKMVGMGRKQDANGIINVSFSISDASQGASQVVVQGTAVVLRPVTNYVPEGVVGNILSAINDELHERNNK